MQTFTPADENIFLLNIVNVNKFLSKKSIVKGIKNCYNR